MRIIYKMKLIRHTITYFKCPHCGTFEFYDERGVTLCVWCRKPVQKQAIEGYEFGEAK